MGLFDFLSGTKRPAAGTPAASPAQVKQAILDLNRPSAPYRILDGTAEGVDLIAEWKIVDADWSNIFQKANLSKVFRIYMKLDPQAHEVRAVDREYTLSWAAGVPQLSVAAEAFRGQKTSVEFGSAYAFTETAELGQVYRYRFNTGEIKGPIQNAVTQKGWTYKGVTFGKL